MGRCTRLFLECTLSHCFISNSRLPIVSLRCFLKESLLLARASSVKKIHDEGNDIPIAQCIHTRPYGENSPQVGTLPQRNRLFHRSLLPLPPHLLLLLQNFSYNKRYREHHIHPS